MAPLQQIQFQCAVKVVVSRPAAHDVMQGRAQRVVVLCYVVNISLIDEGVLVSGPIQKLKIWSNFKFPVSHHARAV